MKKKSEKLKVDEIFSLFETLKDDEKYQLTEKILVSILHWNAMNLETNISSIGDQILMSLLLERNENIRFYDGGECNKFFYVENWSKNKLRSVDIYL
jgi:hypothetical protein